MKKLFFFISLLFLVALASLLWRSATTEAAWFDPIDIETDWSYRVPITVASTSVPANQTDFSLILDLSLLPAGFHTNVKEDGSDIRVTTSDGSTEVPRDIISYSSSTDTGLMRFKGTISSTTNTVFYIYYGNSSATEPVASSTYGRYNAYDDYWEGYWPMHESSGSLSDRTVNAITLTTADDSDVTYGIDGKLGRAISRTTGSFSSSQGVVTDNPATILAWHWPSNLTGVLSVAVLYNTADTNHRLGLYSRGDVAGDPIQAVQWNGGLWSAAQGGNMQNNWNFMGGSFVSDTSRFGYLGLGIYSSTQNAGALNSLDSIVTGYTGKTQHVSIHSIARSQQWIATEYNQTNSNSTFWVVGAGEENPLGVAPKLAVKGTMRVKSDQNLRIRF